MKKKVLLFLCFALLMGSLLMVNEVQAGKKVKISKKKVTLIVGQKKKLKVKNARRKVKWSSKNKKVASVSKKGIVKGKRVGKAKIVAKVGKKKYICKVTVKRRETVSNNGNNKIVETTKKEDVSVTEEQTTVKEAQSTSENEINTTKNESEEICFSYEQATVKGYKGTKEKWIDILSQKNIPENKNAYETVVSDGYKGSLQEYLSSIVESKGDGTTGYEIAVKNGYNKSLTEWLTDLVGGSSTDEKSTIKKSYIDGRKNLIVELHDGNILDLGYVGNLIEEETEFTEETTSKKENPTDAPIDDVSPVISVSDVFARAGDKGIRVAVNVKNNPGILGMTLSIKYDENTMKLKSVENGDAVNSVLTLTAGKELKSGCNFTWDGQEISNAEIKDGSILILTFDISEKANVGEYSINFSYEDGGIVDGNLLPIEFQLKDGKINIQK